MAATFGRKSATPAGKSSSKGIAVAVLTVVLVVVLVRQFTKAAPSEAAPADNGAGGQQIVKAAAKDSVVEVMASLENEPGLHRKTGGLDPASVLEAVPADPFQLSAAWREKLTKAAPEVVVTKVQDPVTQQVTTVTTDPRSTRPTLPPWDTSSVKLSGIFRSNNKMYAVINGSIVSQDMSVAGGHVVEITEDRVTLQQNGAPEAPKVDLIINKGKGR